MGGIGYKKERAIWKQGLDDWNKFLEAGKVNGISKKTKIFYDSELRKAKKELYDLNANYFKLGIENWRLFDFFKEYSLFLDVEVDNRKEIIVIGLYDGYETKTMVRNINLDLKLLEKEIDRCKLLITFNGGAFDLPLLKKFGLKIDKAHIDLKHCCLKLGLNGGLKEVENKLKLNRPKHLNGHPIDLWKALYASFDREYLELLVKYNEEDVINLKFIMEYCYRELRKRFFI